MAYDQGGLKALKPKPNGGRKHENMTLAEEKGVHHFVAHSHTPHNRCVRFVFGVAAASRNTRFQAARYGLTWAGLAPADRPSFAGAFPYSITSSTRRRNDSVILRPSALAVARLMTSPNS